MKNIVAGICRGKNALTAEHVLDKQKRSVLSARPLMFCRASGWVRREKPLRESRRRGDEIVDLREELGRWNERKDRLDPFYRTRTDGSRPRKDI
jgi:hypothetical protein